MQVEHYLKLNQILLDLGSLLRAPKRKHLLWRRENEPSPELFDLSFRPAIKTSTVSAVVDHDLCTLCSRRISYKAGQFDHNAPEQPFLIVVHNAFLAEEAGYFQNPKVNQMFEKIIAGVTGMAASTFLVREALRCHFGKEEVGEALWFQNCQKHILADIEQYRLQGMLVIGAAAPLLFKDKEDLQARVGKTTDFLGVKTVVTPGPSRLVYMQNNRFSADKIQEEKRKIFEAVKLFTSDVMQLQIS